jgi:hypothetical protein
LVPLVVKRAPVQGFPVSDRESEREASLRDVAGWLRDVRLKH